MPKLGNGTLYIIYSQSEKWRVSCKLTGFVIKLRIFERNIADFSGLISRNIHIYVYLVGYELPVREPDDASAQAGEGQEDHHDGRSHGQRPCKKNGFGQRG